MGKATLTKTPKGSLQAKVEESKPVVQVKDSKSAVEIKKPTPTAVDPIEQSAILLAQEWNAEMINDLALASKGKEEWQTRFIPLITHIRESFSKDKINGMPWPNRSEEEAKKIGSNEPYDKYTRDVFRDGGLKKTNFSFYGSMWAASRLGAPIQADLDKYGSKYEQRHADYQGLSVSQWAAKKDKVKKQKDTQIASLRQAMEVIFQMHAIDGMSFVGWEWVKEPDGSSIVQSNRPLVIYNKVSITQTTGAIGPTQFCSYDVREALTKGGSFEAFLKTASRGTGGPEQPKVTAIDVSGAMTFNVKDLNGLSSLFAGIATFVGENSTPISQQRTAELIAACNNDVGMLLSFGDVCSALDLAWTKLEPLYAAANLKRQVDRNNANVVRATQLQATG